MGSIWDWSTTASSNGNADSGVNWLENQAAATVNNSARAMMMRIAELLKDLGCGTATTGSGNAYLLTTSSAFTTYADGRIVGFTANHTNTDTATLSANSIGAKTIFVNGAALKAGEIVSGVAYLAIYDAALNAAAGGWHLMTPTATLARLGMGDVTFALSSGSQGASIGLAAPDTGSAIASGIVLDSSADRIRLFETGGAFRGVYIDITETVAGAASEVWHSGNLTPSAYMDISGYADSYAFLKNTTGSTINYADSVAGSSLVYSDTSDSGSTSPAGTWKCLGRAPAGRSTLFRRTA
jgi:hypothetical protein